MRRVAALLVASFLLSSCVHEPDRYPTGWPGPRVGAACADIVGVYAEVGERDPSPGESPQIREARLSYIVFPRTNDRSKPGLPDAVAISLSNSTYELRSLRGSEVLRTIQLPEGKLTCVDGWLTIEAHSGMPDVGPVAGYEDIAVMLHAADDGSLLVRVPSSITGLAFMVVPMHASGVRYQRFARRGPAPR